VARPGYLPLLAGLLLTVLVWALTPGPWRFYAGVPVTIALLLLANFYRDPARNLPLRSGVFAVAPADGRIVRVDRDGTGLHISIFLSVFDVHVNRAPVGGRVLALRREAGKFLPAFRPEASSANERVVLEIDSAAAGRVVCTQVAGLLARRIQNWIAPGDTLEAGQRYGMIHFGSRVDLTLPATFRPLVRTGAHVSAGATPLAELASG
jgi:phosphatidylserine decarboxylase